MIRRILDRLRTRDPGRDGLRRALRAAIVIPIAAMAGYLLGRGTQAPAITVVGSIALMIVADFPGNRTTRAMGYCGLAINGAVLIALGTLVAPYPWASVVLCFAVGAFVSLLGLISEVIAAGQRASLMVFLLAICSRPVGPVGDRLLGWLIAVLICVPAAVFLFPPRYGSELRTYAAAVCRALADRIEGADSGDRAAQLDTAMAALSREFAGSAFRPVALTAGSRALIRVVSNLQWLADRVDSGTGQLLGHIGTLSVAVLRGSAEVLTSPTRSGAAELGQTVAAHRLIAISHYDNDFHDILAQPDDAAAVELGATLLNRRTMSATSGLTGSLIAAATAADTRPVWERWLGRGLPETGVADRVHGKRTAIASLAGYLSTRSITVINSLRTGLALAVAFAVTLLLPVQNGLWVVLGALSVLRSSAASTRTTAVRAVTGTVIGFVIGAVVLRVVGVDPVVLWALLPIVAFGSTYVLVVGSFAASQAMFTMQVLIVFNMMRPTGWQVGLFRIEDVVIGALVGLVVSVLLWPGGAATAVQRAVGTALAVGSRYLNAAVLR
ncbi:MAG: FUSC family protein, partial [Mycobacterium sp.]